MFLSPQKPFYCDAHELSNATVKFSSPPRNTMWEETRVCSVHQEG